MLAHQQVISLRLVLASGSFILMEIKTETLESSVDMNNGVGFGGTELRSQRRKLVVDAHTDPLIFSHHTREWHAHPSLGKGVRLLRGPQGPELTATPDQAWQPQEVGAGDHCLLSSGSSYNVLQLRLTFK